VLDPPLPTGHKHRFLCSRSYSRGEVQIAWASGVPSPLSRQGGHLPALRGRRSGERAKEIQALIHRRWRKTGSKPEKDEGKTGFVESSLFRMRAWFIRLSLSSRWGLCPRTPARMIAPDMRGRARLSISRWKIMDRRAGVF